ncbi:MAG: methylated-DNA--[protein]-cysteine S-methyltransferase [Tannerellaceae bacterium]|jgi:methylated-DNA-[protein]-cysteine S-methyltransferase|nr:methylated-DNA--[protein]-cysteine S-methyltransferase [Tannerellaceae bacterium]
MNKEATAYWDSPVGCLAITCSDSHLRSISRVELPPPSQPNEPMSALQSKVIKQLSEYFEGKRKTFSLPIEQEGTPFQQSVWEELLRIPYGRCISYQGLAGRIGKPRAYRAVGNANGQNKLCIIVPCHRIIRANGEIGGYAYGLEMKQYLIELEQKG